MGHGVGEDVEFALGHGRDEGFADEGGSFGDVGESGGRAHVGGDGTGMDDVDLGALAGEGLEYPSNGLSLEFLGVENRKSFSDPVPRLFADAPMHRFQSTFLHPTGAYVSGIQLLEGALPQREWHPGH